MACLKKAASVVAGFGTREKVAFGAHNCTLQFLRERILASGEGGRWLLVVVSVSLMCVRVAVGSWGKRYQGAQTKWH